MTELRTPRLLRIEARNSETPIERKPAWIKTRATMGPEYRDMQARVSGGGLHTGPPGGRLPQHFRMLGGPRGVIALVGGDACTPAGATSARSGRTFGRVRPRRAPARRGIRRRDGPEVRHGHRRRARRPARRGSWLYAETCYQIRALAPGTGVELLVDDFGGDADALATVFAAAPEVFAHNVETVPRIFRRIRPAFDYDRSLGVLGGGASGRVGDQVESDPGMGETRAEVSDALANSAPPGPSC